MFRALPGLAHAVVELVLRALRLHLADDRVRVLVDLRLNRLEVEPATLELGQVG